MIKAVFCVVSVVFGLYFGMQMGAKYKRRERYFRDLMLFCNDYMSEMNFCQRKLVQVLTAKGEDFSKELKKNFEEFSLALESGQENPQDLLSLQDLSLDELALVRRIFGSLGRSDASTQSELLQGYKELVRQKYELARENSKKYNGMHAKLGFLAGLLLAVLII